MAEVLLTNAGVVAGLMLAVWLASLPLEDVSIVDIAWGLGFVLVAWATFGLVEGGHPRCWLLAGLATVWGLRLAGYLGWRKYGEPEDHRYAEMRQRHGERFGLVSLLTVFALQGVIMWVVSLPLQVGQAASTSGGLTWLDGAGAAVWAVGVFFEAVGDFQLARFKADPANRGQVMDRGLWRYTRHPNYFGDFLVWWGLYLVAVASGGAWWTIVSPLVMSVLLMHVSGVAMLEKSLEKRRAGYREYVRRTSAFFPLPPKQSP